MSTETQINGTAGNTLQVLCSYCKVTTRHKVLASVDQKGEEELEDSDYFYWNSNY